MRTEFFVEYDLYDTTALQDAQESSVSNSSFADIAMIKNDVSAPRYGTLEHNFFVLDGNAEEFPEEPEDLVYFSSSYSGADGNFSADQSINIQFTENHTSYGVVLHFLDDYPLELEISWYDIFDILQSRKKFYPDKKVFLCRNQVEDYGRIVIRFLRALPYHNVKLQYIEYGTTIVWGNDTIKTGTLINDTDPISDKIATDKLTFEFIDELDEFNLGNTEGLHKLFQRKQRMLPYEVMEGKKIQLGTFFLDSNSTTNNVCKISAIDYKGILANTDFMNGRIYVGERAGNIIDEIMESAGISEYVVDPETAATPVYGTLSIQSCQKALREVLFACGSTINTSKRMGIELKKRSRNIKGKLSRDKKFSTTYETDKYVSDVNVKYQTWKLSGEKSEIVKGMYETGIYTIQFSEPATDLTTNSGIILKQMPYYAILKVDDENPVEVIISGKKYVMEELAASARIENIKSGETRNTKTFSGSLLNYKSAQRIANDILDYYQLQQVIKSKYLSADEAAGDWMEIENTMVGHADFVACLESVSTDLTGGFISTATCRGYYKMLTEYYYAGNELFANEETEAII